MKIFNTVGVVSPVDHYFLPHRLDWNEITGFIDKGYYFTLHASYQSGKTTEIMEFVDHINQEGKYTAIYINVKSAHTAANNIEQANYCILGEFKKAINHHTQIDEKISNHLLDILAQKPTPENGVADFLAFFAKHNVKPVVIFFDEFDGLVGNSLISILKQFRCGHTNRPRYFPQSICFIDVYDLRNYAIESELQAKEFDILYSRFNIKAESLLLPNFTQEDVKKLYEQHTTETGQLFTPDAIEYAFYLTQGQPWLVNALAYQACFRDVQDRSQPITKEVIDRAKEALIARRDTHLDALTDRIKEPRVRHITDAIISRKKGLPYVSIDDLQYVRDLGLITQKGFAITNPIYQEIIACVERTTTE